MNRKNKIILESLKEYERNHYETEDKAWQRIINKLIQDYSNGK